MRAGQSLPEPARDAPHTTSVLPDQSLHGFRGLTFLLHAVQQPPLVTDGGRGVGAGVQAEDQVAHRPAPAGWMAVAAMASMSHRHSAIFSSASIVRSSAWFSDRWARTGAACWVNQSVRPSCTAVASGSAK